MNFLQLAQDVRKRVGIQGTGPSSVSATGYEALILAAVHDAWQDLQGYRDNWAWMRTKASFTIGVAATEYTPTTILGPTNRFRVWIPETCYAEILGKKVPMRYIDDYDYYMSKHINDTVGTKPTEFTIKTDKSTLVFNMVDAPYNVICSYYKSPQELVLATDTPEMPAIHHLWIVYEAIARYSASISMTAMYQLYSGKADILLGQIMRDFIPAARFQVRGIA